MDVRLVNRPVSRMVTEYRNHGTRARKFANRPPEKNQPRVFSFLLETNTRNPWYKGKKENLPMPFRITPNWPVVFIFAHAGQAYSQDKDETPPKPATVTGPVSAGWPG